VGWKLKSQSDDGSEVCEESQSTSEQRLAEGWERTVAAPASSGGRLQMDELEHQFTYHSPNADQVARMQQIREKALVLARAIQHLVPAGADSSAAIRKLRECVMTANAGIVLERATGVLILFVVLCVGSFAQTARQLPNVQIATCSLDYEGIRSRVLATYWKLPDVYRDQAISLVDQIVKARDQVMDHPDEAFPVLCGTQTFVLLHDVADRLSARAHDPQDDGKPIEAIYRVNRNLSTAARHLQAALQGDGENRTPATGGTRAEMPQDDLGRMTGRK
jgi:hypothetical protein